MKYHALSALLLFIAVILEAMGSAGVTVFLIGGVGCAVWLWMRVTGATSDR